MVGLTDVAHSHGGPAVLGAAQSLGYSWGNLLFLALGCPWSQSGSESTSVRNAFVCR